MAKNIRTLVAILSVPFALTANSAMAYKSDCKALLDVAAVQISNQNNYVKGTRWETNSNALLTKLAGVDAKLSEYPPKTGDALQIVGDMLLKISDWVDAAKPKLTPWGADAIEGTLVSADPTMGTVTSCIQGL